MAVADAAGGQPQAEESRSRRESHDEAEAAKARRARSRPDSARRAERDWSSSRARRRRARGVRVAAPARGFLRPMGVGVAAPAWGLLRARGVGVGVGSGVLEAVKKSGEGELGLGFGVPRLETSRKGGSVSSQRFMATEEGRRSDVLEDSGAGG